MKIKILSSASVVGREEDRGPLGGSFDITDTKDDRFGMETWEKSESEMQRLALGCAMNKCGMSEDKIDAMLAGD